VAVWQWRQTVVPLPSLATPIHKGKDQIPGSQSQRAVIRTNRETDTQTSSAP